MVFVGLDGLNQSRENLLVSNTKTFVGANVTVVSIHTVNITRSSASQVDPCKSVGEVKRSEEPSPTLENGPISPFNLPGQ